MKKLLSLLLSLALCLSILPTAAFAAEDSGNTASTKKISVRMNAKNGKSTDSVSDGVSTAYGTTHTLTVTPQTGRYVIAGYFAGTDYIKKNPSKYEYKSMTLNKINADASTGAVTYQFTATEVIPIENDHKYDYICLYFHCAKLPTLQWMLENVSGEATAPSVDGKTAAKPYISKEELCGDPNEYTGYYSLADKTDRPYLDWQVISITDKEGNTAGGTVAFDNNHLTYTPTADEAGKTVTITIRPKLGYVEEANTPLSFEIEVKKPVVEQSEFYVTMVIDGHGNAVAMPNSAKEGEKIQLTAKPDKGHHFKEWQATSDNIRITNDKFTMPAENVTVKAIFEADTYTVRLDANGGTIASGQDVTSYTYGVGATLPTKDDMTREGYTFDGWYDNNGFSGSSVTTISPTDTGAKTFYAKWTINSYSVTFNSNDGSDIDAQTVDYGDTVAEPTAPTKNGYTFAGWYSDEGLVSAYDFSTTVTSDITLYAKWTKNSSGGSYTPPTYKPTINQSDEGGTVSVDKTNPKKGDTVTITAKPDSGYQLDDLTVTDKNGNELKLTDKGNGKYIFTMPASKVTVSATFAPEKSAADYFADVPANSYYADAVLWAAKNGITGGIGNGLFGPNQPCTRAQIVTFLWRAAGSPEPKSMSSFSDVSADSYYAKAVAWAVENGITTGTGDGKFSPDATCTRAQSVTFLFRAIGKLVDSKAEFSDVLTDSYYANAVAWAVENGVTNGIGDGLFGPDNSCTRAQIVTFLFRAYQGK